MNNGDLISRSALLENMNAVVFRNVPVEHQPYVQAACEAFETVAKAAPAVDAEVVVRCKDCKHWGTGYGGETEHIKVCEFANYMVGENGYCVYGERKMDAEVE